MKSSKKALATKRLRIKAFGIWKQLVFLKYGEYCIQCGNPAITAHHYFPQGSCEALRYEIKNGVPVCQGCHFSHHNGQPTLHTLVLRARNQNWHDKLQYIKYKPPHISISQKYLMEIIVKLQKELDKQLKIL